MSHRFLSSVGLAAAEHLLRMNEIKRVPTRPLTGFEDRALRSLQNGEDLAAEATSNRIRLMGAIRAAKQCLECHEVKRGDLLGTFSYELQRDPLLRLTK